MEARDTLQARAPPPMRAQTSSDSTKRPHVGKEQMLAPVGDAGNASMSKLPVCDRRIAGTQPR